MRILIELSGEHPTLPRAEALAALESERCAIRSLSWNPKVLRVDATGPVERAVRRIGLAHVVSEEVASGDFEDVRRYARGVDLAGASFRVRARGLGVKLDRAVVEKTIGAEFARTGRVNLTAPRLDYRVLVGDAFAVGRVLYRVDRSSLESHKVAHRPFSLPISLHPKFARALVNLSRAPTAGRLLDPFCGTGGILLEASRLGIRGIGSDVRREMVHGARTSLHAFREDATFLIADAGAGPWRPASFDGIATDPPYGRASSTRGEPLLRLYDRAFERFADVLRPGRAVAVVVPDPKALEVGSRYLDLVESHAVHVHRTLTRTFCVFRRRGG